MADTETRAIASHVPASLADQVDALASRLKRSQGSIVEQALAEFVALEERRYRMTLESLASVDAGEGVPHEHVQRWIASLGTDNALSVPK